MRWEGAAFFRELRNIDHHHQESKKENLQRETLATVDMEVLEKLAKPRAILWPVNANFKTWTAVVQADTFISLLLPNWPC